jgi:hypothetical protein
VREFCIVRSSARCEYQPYNWVCREGRERERGRKRDMQAKSIDKTICFPIISRNTVLWDWCCVLLPSIIFLSHHSCRSEI